MENEAFLTDTDRRHAAALIEETRRQGGLAPVDLARFWEDQQRAAAAPFDAAIPQVPLGIMMSDECLFAELELAEDWDRWSNDMAWRRDLCRAYNDRAEGIVGRRLLRETHEVAPSPPPLRVGGLHDVFEARNEWVSGSWWLHPSAGTPAELEALLDRVERRDLRSVILPSDWDARKRAWLDAGRSLPIYRGQRGPITFACSIFGPENLIFLLADQPDLAARFRDAILNSMLGIARLLDDEAGYSPETAPRGFSFCDDNCCLMTPAMYAFFGEPILRGLFERYAPDPGDRRYQHSDSAMGHLLPILGRLHLTGVNFGPTLSVTEIRRHLPRAVIHGQLAPFTFSRNEEQAMVLEFLRDARQARAERGLVFATAGSINNGSRLTGMRLIMSAIQRFRW